MPPINLTFFRARYESDPLIMALLDAFIAELNDKQPGYMTKWELEEAKKRIVALQKEVRDLEAKNFRIQQQLVEAGAKMRADKRAWNGVSMVKKDGRIIKGRIRNP